MWVLNGYYGLAILSKHPIVGVSSSQLPSRFYQEPRILTKTEVNVYGTDINIYNTHLNSKNKETRIKQYIYIENHLKMKQPTLLMGDFNVMRNTDYFSIPHMQGINKNMHRTFENTGHPDDIFCSKDFKVDNSYIKNSSFSDHNILYCVLSFSSINK